MAILVAALISPRCLAAPVSTRSGLVEGVASGVDGVTVYRGIPYAAPPVGNLRWRPPQPPAAWEGVRLCDQFGPSCPQPKMTGIYRGADGPTDEDCLYLNIWTPATSPDGRLPVLVWIHGGGLTIGSGSMRTYHGHNLAARGAVVVTINYRLGPFGFFPHPALSAESAHGVSGNYGLLDQVAALRWVQGNIEAFGGDPRHVAIFGESGGSQSVLCLMASPLSAGLFRGAIAESGTPGDGLRVLRDGTPAAGRGTGESAEEMGVRLAGKLGCTGPDVLAQLRSKTAEELLTGINPDVLPGGRGDKFNPVIDGYVLAGDPLAAFAAGEQQDVPLIIGSNGDDGNVFTDRLPIRSLTGYRVAVRTLFGTSADKVLEYFPADETNVRRVLTRLVTISAFIAPARRFARGMANVDADVHVYHFTRVSPQAAEKGLGAIHGIEIPYVFGADMIRALGPTDQALSDTMSETWIRFAATGDPSGDGLVWPPYDAGEQYIEFGDTVEVRSQLYSAECDLFDDIRNARLNERQ
jgi:para-nitrobenzyl esterase